MIKARSLSGTACGDRKRSFNQDMKLTLPFLAPLVGAGCSGTRRIPFLRNSSVVWRLHLGGWPQRCRPHAATGGRRRRLRGGKLAIDHVRTAPSARTVRQNTGQRDYPYTSRTPKVSSRVTWHQSPVRLRTELAVPGQVARCENACCRLVCRKSISRCRERLHGGGGRSPELAIFMPPRTRQNCNNLQPGWTFRPRIFCSPAQRVSDPT